MSAKKKAERAARAAVRARMGFLPIPDDMRARRLRRSFRFSVAACLLFTAMLWYADGYKRFSLRETQYRMALTEEPQSARAVLRNVVRRDTEANGTPRPQYVQALAAVEESDRVLERYQEAYALDPINADLALVYGCRLFLAARYQDALERFREAGALAPKNALPVYLEAAAMAALAADRNPPADMDEDLRQVFLLVDNANGSGNPIVFPEPLWHDSLPKDGVWLARARRALVLQCCAPLNRLKDIVLRRAAQENAPRKAPAAAWLRSLEALGIRLQGDSEDRGYHPEAVQLMTAIQLESTALRARQRVENVPEAEVREQALSEAMEQLKYLDDRLSESEQSGRQRIAQPFVWSVYGLLTLAAFYAISAVAERLRRKPARPQAAWPRAAVFSAACGLLASLALLLVQAALRKEDAPAGYFEILEWAWGLLLAIAAVAGPAVVAYLVTVQRRATASLKRGAGEEVPGGGFAVTTRLRQYYGMLCGGFVFVFCVWITLQRLLEGAYPWQAALILSNHQEETRAVTALVWKLLAGSGA